MPPLNDKLYDRVHHLRYFRWWNYSTCEKSVLKFWGVQHVIEQKITGTKLDSMRSFAVNCSSKGATYVAFRTPFQVHALVRDVELLTIPVEMREWGDNSAHISTFLGSNPGPLHTCWLPRLTVSRLCTRLCTNPFRNLVFL